MAKSLLAVQQSCSFVPFYILFFGKSLGSVQVVARVVEVSMFQIVLKGYTHGGGNYQQNLQIDAVFGC